MPLISKENRREKTRSRSTFVVTCAAACLVVAFASLARAQTPARTEGVCKMETPKEPPDSKAETSGLRIVVKGADGKPVANERFYLLSKSVSAAGGLDWASLPRRDEFLKGASAELRARMDEHDCATPFCAELLARKDVMIREVPEFKSAFEEGLRKYRNRQLALDWLMVNFPLEDNGTRFYELTKDWLQQAARKTGAVSSIMTNDKGEAIFTKIKPGDYQVSNLKPTEEGLLFWDCAAKVLPPATQKLYFVTLELSAPAPAQKPAQASQ